jgi:hypothetical protein
MTDSLEESIPTANTTAYEGPAGSDNEATVSGGNEGSSVAGGSFGDGGSGGTGIE